MGKQVKHISPETTSAKTTHFGFETVGWDEKEKKVEAVFESVAAKYDLMNNLMSLGVHHLWKRFAVELSRVRPGQIVLDLAGGSGDLTRLMSDKVGEQGFVVLADINQAMIEVGRNRLLDEGVMRHVDFTQANAECLPFADNSFHCIVMAFGLRNVTDKEAALRSMYRVCKPGGRVLILEFSTPTFGPLQTVYDWYSFNLLPKLGKLCANDEASYQYLVESIRQHPNQEALKQLILQTGFEDCHYHNLSGGIVALHVAYKY